MVHVFTLLEKSKWISYIKGSLGYDFYHSWSFHKLDDSGEPILFVYQEDSVFIAFPLIKRKIENSCHYDLTSVYGYPGPVSNISPEGLSEVFLNNFKNAFLDFLKNGNFISVFSRLNPFLNQITLLERFGGLYNNGETVALDLTISYEEQQAKYKKNVLASINQLREEGYRSRVSNSREDIELFKNIYEENMARVGATSNYYFRKSYFEDILYAEDFTSLLIFIEKDNEPVCSALNTYNNGVMQGHLIGTRAAALHFSPARLMVDELSIIGRNLKINYLHFGGGRGFKRDSLFSWKAAFSDLFLPYYSWRFIADEQAYNALLERSNIDKSSAVDFFPLYRYQFAEV